MGQTGDGIGLEAYLRLRRGLENHDDLALCITCVDLCIAQSDDGSLNLRQVRRPCVDDEAYNLGSYTRLGLTAV